MGENNTAGLDPIFFFHHCFIDRMFWLWQKQNNQSTKLDMDPALANYPGTSSYDNQGPTPTIMPGETLSLQTPLRPFEKTAGSGDYYTSEDCVDTEGQLGYTYEPGSFEGSSAVSFAADGRSSKRAILTGIDRAIFEGSFVLKAYAMVTLPSGESQRYFLGHEAVLSRRNVIHCANCLTHMEVVAHFSLGHLPDDLVDKATFGVEYDHRGAEGSPTVSAKLAGGPEALKNLNYHFEVME
jgi:tyrosinase